MKRLAFPFFSILLFAVPLAWAQRQLVDRVVAVVNEEAVTQSELDVYLRPLYDELRQQYEGEELMRQLNDARLKLLNQMIEDRLVFQEAKARAIQVEENEIDRMVEEVRGRFGSETEFENMFLAQGYSLSELRENFRRQLAIRKLHDMEIRAQVVVSPREIEEHYQDHLSEFAEEEKIRIRSITIRKDPEAIEKGLTDEAAQGKIESVERRIRTGENFEKLAREFSEDANVEAGGQAGWIKRGQLLPSIDEVLFKLESGAVSPVLETPVGYHLFRIEEKKTGQIPSLDEVREKIQALLFRQEAQKRFKAWMEELKARAYISIR